MFCYIFLVFCRLFRLYPGEWEGSISPSSFHLSFFSKFTDVLFILTCYIVCFSKLLFIFLGTLRNTSRQSKQNTPKKLGVQSALSQELEVYIVTSLDPLTNWKIPFDGSGVRCLVKAYLDQEKLQIKYFKNNFPGPDWLQGFIKHHRLTKRITTDNVKASRAEVNEDVINDYFNDL